MVVLNKPAGVPTTPTVDNAHECAISQVCALLQRQQTQRGGARAEHEENTFCENAHQRAPTTCSVTTLSATPAATPAATPVAATLAAPSLQREHAEDATTRTGKRQDKHDGNQYVEIDKEMNREVNKKVNGEVNQEANKGFQTPCPTTTSSTSTSSTTTSSTTTSSLFTTSRLGVCVFSSVCVRFVRVCVCVRVYQREEALQLRF